MPPVSDETLEVAEAARPPAVPAESAAGGTSNATAPATEALDAPASLTRTLWRNRDFRLITAGQGLSALGDGVTLTALPLLVLILTGSGVQMGIVGVLQLIPDLIFGLPAGALADRWDRRRIMVAADIFRAVLAAMIPLSLLLGGPTMTVIFLVTAPIGLGRVFYLAAYTGAIPRIVPHDQLGPANSYMEAIYSIGFIVGPIIAGTLIAVIGPGPTLAIDAASFVASAIFVALIRRPLQERTQRPSTHILADIREGVLFVIGHRLLRTTIAFMTTVALALTAVVPAITFFVTVDRGYGSETVGFVVAAYGAGSVVGSLAASRLTRGALGPLMIVGNIISAVLVAGMPLFDGEIPWMIGSFGAGVSTVVVLVAYITLRAAVTPNPLLGRVGSIARMITLGLQPIGMIAAGILLDAVGGGWTLFAMGAFGISTSLLFALSGTLRQARGPSSAATSEATLGS